MVSVENLIESINQRGWAVVTNCMKHTDSLRLKAECEAAYQSGDFQPAGVGHGMDRTIREDIRQDQVMWIDPHGNSFELETYLAKLENLRLTLNQHFFLGLFDFEGHFAIYPKGAFYKAHLDRHAGTIDRIVTVILYLNPDWQPGDGGELKLWTTSGERDGAFQLIEPRMGTMVYFLSGEFWHEVMPAQKTRTSITGWFRQR